ncbi:MAG: hypothetical protein NT009_11885 [Proteobacteria bacterium]|nr:hypothetical protein [Pseudomonadota bacterium]
MNKEYSDNFCHLKQGKLRKIVTALNLPGAVLYLFIKINWLQGQEYIFEIIFNGTLFA